MSANLRDAERLLALGAEGKVTVPVSPGEAAALLAELDALRSRLAQERAS